MKMRQGGREWHSRTTHPSTPSSFPRFLYLPLNLNAWNRLGIGFHGTRKNQNPQGLFQVGETCRIKQPFFFNLTITLNGPVR